MASLVQRSVNNSIIVIRANNRSIGLSLSNTIPFSSKIPVQILSLAFRLFCVALLETVALGQSRETASRSVEIMDLAPPVSASSGQPFLQVTPENRLLLSWMEPGKSRRHALRFATSSRNTWEHPETVIEGDDFFVNWADVPSVVQLANGTVAAHWLKKNGKGTYAYDVRLRMRRRGSAAWSTAITPHRDGTQTEHGFVSLIDAPPGDVEALWLDGRDMAGKGGHDGHGEGGSMALRSAVVVSDGSLREETELDPRVCECCPTAVARTETGIIAAYRDRSEAEVRDIFVVRKENGRWREPQRVHEDGWQIPGCPVNGPALSAVGRNVAIAWFTAAGGEAKVLVAFSRDNGTSFGKPFRVDQGKPLGRVDLAMLPDGTALVSWIEWHEEISELVVRHLGPDGSKEGGTTITRISAERASGYPRMVLMGEDVFFAWTDVEGPKSVRVGKVPVQALIRVQ